MATFQLSHASAGLAAAMVVVAIALLPALAQQPPPPNGGEGPGAGVGGGGTGESAGTGCPTLTTCGTAGANAFVDRSNLAYDSVSGKFSGSITTNLCPAWSTSNNAQPDCIEQAIPDPSFASGPNPAPLLGRLGMTLEAGTNIYGPFEAGFVEGFACTGGDCEGGIDVLTCQLELTYECDGNTYDDSLFEDQCGGHASPYHIHTDPVCSYDATDGTGHSALLGVALDGYGIYGKYEGANFELPCLDACRGHTGTVPGGDDWSLTTSSSVYHYHVKALEEDVYPDLWTVGCFGPVASVAECEALYSTCGDDSTSVTVAGGVVVTYDYYCPCWEPPACTEDAAGNAETDTDASGSVEDDCEFSAEVCEACPDGDNCLDLLIAHCDSVQWAGACQHVSVECPFESEGSPCAASVCQPSSDDYSQDECTQALQEFCSGSDDPGCANIDDCEFSAEVCEACPGGDNCLDLLIAHCESVQWAGACQHVSVACPFESEGSPCTASVCQTSSDDYSQDECSQALWAFCSGSDDPGCANMDIPTPTSTVTPTPTATLTPPPPTLTAAPTEMPTATSTEMPTATSTEMPTATSTATPTAMPTATSTEMPTTTPTAMSTTTPTAMPTPAQHTQTLVDSSTVVSAFPVEVDEDLEAGTGDITISACVNQDTNTKGYVVANAQGDSDTRCAHLFLDGTTNAVQLFYGGQAGSNLAASITLESPVDDSSWHAVAVTVTDRQATFFVNAVAVGTAQLSQDVVVCSGVTYVGARPPSPGSFVFSGRMSNVLVSNHARDVSSLHTDQDCSPPSQELVEYAASFPVEASLEPVVDGSFTVAGCVKQDPGNKGYLFANSNGNTDNRCIHVFLDGTTDSITTFFAGASGSPVSYTVDLPYPIDDGSWHSVAVRFSALDTGVVLQTLVDGVGLHTTTLSATVSSCAGTTYVGARAPSPGQFVFSGEMGGVVVFNSALGVAELAAMECSGFAQDTSVELVESASSFPVTIDSFPSFSDTFSVSSCVKQTAGNRGYLVGNSRANTDDRCAHVFLDGSDDSVTLFHGAHTAAGAAESTAKVSLAAPLDDGSWHAVAVVVDAGAMVVFVDGEVAGQATVSGSVVSCPAGTTLVGARPPTPGWFELEGEVSSLEVHTFALSSAEVSQLECGEDDDEPVATTVVDEAQSFPVGPVSIPSLANDLSLAACVKQATGNRAYVLGNSLANDDHRCFHLFLDGSADAITLFYGGHTGGSHSSVSVSAVVDDNAWHSVGVSITGGAATFFVDGSVVGQAALSGSVQTCTGGTTLVGARPPTSGSFVLSGELTDVTMFNYAIDAAASAVCSGGGGGTATELVSSATSFPVSASMPALANELSVTACVKQVPDNKGYVVANADGNSDARCLHLFLDGTASQMHLYYGAHPSAASPSNRVATARDVALDDNAWHSLAVVVTASPSTATFYADGYVVGEVALDSEVASCTGTTLVGARPPTPGSFLFSGEMGAVTVYDYALSAAEADVQCGMQLPVETTVDAATDAVSVTACMQQAPSNKGYVLANAAGDNDARCLHLFADGTTDKLALYFNQHNGGARKSVSSSAATFDDGNTHAVAVVVGSGTVTFFVDGVDVGGGAVPSGSEVVTCPDGLSLIGARPPSPGSFVFEGSLWGVTVHTRAISAAEASFQC